MSDDKRLDPDRLYRACDPASLGFATTAELEPLAEALGQHDALDAIAFGLGISAPGYNIYVVGLSGSGRAGFVRDMLRDRAAAGPTPPDWCYVFNFEDRRAPRALALPAGRGPELQADMRALVVDLRNAIRSALQSEDVLGRRTAALQQREQAAQTALDTLRRELEEEPYVALIGTPEAFTVTPARGGEPLDRDTYLSLPEELRERIDARLREARSRLAQVQGRILELGRDAHGAMGELTRDVAARVADRVVGSLRAKYADTEGVAAYLDAVAADAARNAIYFASDEDESATAALPGARPGGFFRRYDVNVLTTHPPDSGAPVVEEPVPVLGNLLGRLEREVHMGTMVTDFTRVAPGALHRANGGYLVLEAADVLSHPLVWPGLKRVLESGELRPAEPSMELGVFVADSLQPEPIPARVKVVLIGDPGLYGLLGTADPDFRDLFKVKSDFRPRMERTAEAEHDYGRFIAARSRRDALPSFDAGAVAAIVEEGSRQAGDQAWLTTRFADVADLVRETGHWARVAGHDPAGAADVARALDERDRRDNRPHRELLDLVERDVLAFEPNGEQVGQLHGIGLLPAGDSLLGRPIRVMASAFMGRGGVINIEREARLSGPLHSKGFLVLSGYMGWRFAGERPLIFAASLSFDQLYEEVEGDSASVAELYALLSAIGRVPLRQGVAVTGALNQQGLVLPVGGVTEKVEGFFRACERVGLTGEQGVILPRRNVSSLALRAFVRDAVAVGRFHIWAIDRVEEGWPILTGRDAGDPDHAGRFPPGTIHAAVADRMDEWVERWRRLNRDPVPSDAQAPDELR